MLGIFFFVIIGLWVFISIKLSKRFFRSTSPLWKGRLFTAISLVLLLIAPVADEVIGGVQFYALCHRYSGQYIDEQNAANRDVMYIPPTSENYAPGTAVKIRIDPVEFRDAETHRVLVKYYTLHAKGGWFIRMLGISETDGPLLFNSGCAPDDADAFKRRLNIKVVN